MKFKVTISYKASIINPIVSDSTEMDCISTKQTYQKAYRIFNRIKKRFYPSLIFKGIKIEMI